MSTRDESLEKAAEEFVDKEICFGGLEYPLSGNTNKECVKSYLAGARWREQNPTAEVLEMAALIKHALHFGHLGDGSTKGWAEECIAAFRASQGEK